MSKKPTAKTTKTPTRITQETPKAAPNANPPKEAENAPKVDGATTVSSTDPTPAVASEPAFPDVHSLADQEHPMLHRLHGMVHSTDATTPARIKGLKGVDLSQYHPVTQKYRDDLVGWIAS